MGGKAVHALEKFAQVAVQIRACEPFNLKFHFIKKCPALLPRPQHFDKSGTVLIVGIEIFDAEHSSIEEQRFIRIGQSSKRLLFTVFAIDEASRVINLISSREVERWERKAYEEEST